MEEIKKENKKRKLSETQKQLEKYTNNERQVITNMDLYNKKYSIKIIEDNIEKLNKKIILSTQILTTKFCIKYILDDDIESGSEDSYIFDKNYILERQPHITEEEFDMCYNARFSRL